MAWLIWPVPIAWLFNPIEHYVSKSLPSQLYVHISPKGFSTMHFLHCVSSMRKLIGRKTFHTSLSDFQYTTNVCLLILIVTTVTYHKRVVILVHDSCLDWRVYLRLWASYIICAYTDIITCAHLFTLHYKICSKHSKKLQLQFIIYFFDALTPWDSRIE